MTCDVWMTVTEKLSVSADVSSDQSIALSTPGAGSKESRFTVCCCKFLLHYISLQKSYGNDFENAFFQKCNIAMTINVNVFVYFLQMCVYLCMCLSPTAGLAGFITGVTLIASSLTFSSVI